MRIGVIWTMGMVWWSVLASHADAQDVANGADVFKKCRVCHEVGPEAKNKIGPALRGLFGRKAGIADDFNYSEAMREAGTKGLGWSEEAVDKYLDNPRGFIPENKMAFPGVKDEADRKNVIAYLKSVSQ